MRLRTLGMLGLIVLIAFAFVACKKAPPPVLKEIGPTKTKAGVDFQVQPDGVSAMWFSTENGTPDTVIIWAGNKIRTDYKDPKLITAPIPKDLYAKPGQYEIYLMNTKTGTKSNSLIFTVTD